MITQIIYGIYPRFQGDRIRNAAASKPSLLATTLTNLRYSAGKFAQIGEE